MEVCLKPARIPLGRLDVTSGVLCLLETERLFWANGLHVVACLERHAAGDWGDVDAEDWRANDQAIENGTRLLSAYALPDGTRIWIITEADRSVTTILLPSEY